jgi:hypothetical protein
MTTNYNTPELLLVGAAEQLVLGSFSGIPSACKPKGPQEIVEPSDTLELW